MLNTRHTAYNYYILEEQVNGNWKEFLRLAAKFGSLQSLLSWSAGWFSNATKTFAVKLESGAVSKSNKSNNWRLRRVAHCDPHGWWDGEKMTHRPLCIGGYDA